jgi:hypothetical protein
MNPYITYQSLYGQPPPTAQEWQTGTGAKLGANQLINSASLPAFGGLPSGVVPNNFASLGSYLNKTNDVGSMIKPPYNEHLFKGLMELSNKEAQPRAFQGYESAGLLKSI